MDRHRGLTVLEGCKVLSHSHRNRRIAGNDFFDQTAHGLKTEGEGCDVKQEPIFVAAVAGKQIGLERGTDCHDFIRVDISQRFAIKVISDSFADAGHAGGTADEHHTFYFITLETGIF